MSIAIAIIHVKADNKSDSIRIQHATINKSVRELAFDSIDLSSPLNSFLSRSYVMRSGKKGLWHDISTVAFSERLPADAPEVEVSDEQREKYLDTDILEIITYKDSVAMVINRSEPDWVGIYCTVLENGKWVNNGDDLSTGQDGRIEKLIGRMPKVLAEIPRRERINITPDVGKFVEFISTVDCTPEDYLMEKLQKHKLVINGEYHRRKASWDMLQNLVENPQFPETAGTVFMELPSWQQSEMDAFLKSDDMDKEKLLDIFRNEQPNGWWDKGEFDFICKVWDLNQNLPTDKRIKIILADYQIPYSEIQTAEDCVTKEDRNTHMADVISDYILKSDDKRNHLFLVGTGHADKSDKIAGAFSSADGKEAALTAGAQLKKRLGEENVFAVTQHSLTCDNRGYYGQLRNGVFDKAFELNDNRPIGFDLKDSPFGLEPYDADLLIKYDPLAGNWEDNYDGFLFLHSLSDEPANSPLSEIFSAEFVEEMKRRAKILGFEDYKWMWFGTTASEMTPQSVLKAIEAE